MKISFPGLDIESEDSIRIDIRDYGHADKTAKITAKINWMPIETAPKDGTLMLGLGKYHEIFLFYYCMDDWYEFHVCGEIAYEITPILWMPLPKPPN